MELGTFNDFFKSQPQLDIFIPPIYYKENQKWGFTEILPGLIVKNPLVTDISQLQEMNNLCSNIRGWAYSILMNLEWKHTVERNKCLENLQTYIDQHHPSLKGPVFISRAHINRKWNLKRRKKSS